MDTDNYNSPNSREAFTLDDELPVIEPTFQQELEITQEETAIKLFSVFTENLPADLEKINQAYQQNNFPLMENLVCDLHAAACYSCARRLQEAAEHLQETLNQEDYTAHIDELLATLNREVQSVLKYAKQQDAVNEG